MRAEFRAKAEFYGMNDEDAGIVKGFVHKHNYEMAVLMDPKKTVARQFGVNAIPTLLVIDRAGMIRTHFIGSGNEKIWCEAIAKAIE